MENTQKQDEQIANMAFATVYPLYVAKVERKGRTVKELQEVILWLTGYDEADLHRLIENLRLKNSSVKQRLTPMHG